MPVIYAVGNQGTQTYWQLVLDAAGAKSSQYSIRVVP